MKLNTLVFGGMSSKFGSGRHRSIGRAKLVPVTGNELVEAVRKAYALNEEKVMVSYNGVDAEKFNPGNRSERLCRMIGSEHIIIFSCELFAQRGLDVLLRSSVSQEGYA